MTQSTDQSPGCIAPELRGVCADPLAPGIPLPLCLKHAAEIWDFCNERLAAAWPKLAGARETQSVGRAAAATGELAAIQAQVEHLRAERDVELARIRAETMDEAVQIAAAAEAARSDSVVYYVRFADRVKIGTTTNLTRRLAALPHDELLATERGGRVVESIRHRQFQALRVVGEWFNSGPDLLAHIAAVARGRASLDLRSPAAQRAWSVTDAAERQISSLSARAEQVGPPRLFDGPAPDIAGVTSRDVLDALAEPCPVDLEDRAPSGRDNGRIGSIADLRRGNRY